MCGRYYADDRDEAMQRILEALNRAPLTGRMTAALGREAIRGGEVAPSQIVPALAANRRGGRDVFPMRWGYTLRGRSGLVINARSETAAEKPLFRESWRARRCVLPASGYYEWAREILPNGRQRLGQRYAIRPAQPAPDGLVYLAGLYRIEENGFPAAVILTRAPGEEIAWLHDRMPLILSREDAEVWIRAGSDPEPLLSRAVTRVRLREAQPERA